MKPIEERQAIVEAALTEARYEMAIARSKVQALTRIQSMLLSELGRN